MNGSFRLRIFGLSFPESNDWSEASGAGGEAGLWGMEFANGTIEVEGIRALKMIPQEKGHCVEGDRAGRDGETQVSVGADAYAISDEFIG